MSGEGKNPDSAQAHEKPSVQKPPEAPARPDAPLLMVERQRIQAEQKTRNLPPGEQVALREEADAAAARLNSALAEQKNNEQILSQSRESVLADYRGSSQYYVHSMNGKLMVGDGNKVYTQGMNGILELHKSQGHSSSETYDMLVAYGKDAKNNPEALKAFMRDLISLLNQKYDDKKALASAGSNRDILEQYMNQRGSVKNLICGPIAEFAVRFLNEIGVDAAVVSGQMLSQGGKNSGHAIVMYKVDSQHYTFMGGSADNFIVTAPNIDIALKNAFKMSQAMSSSGYVTVQGLEKGEYYSRFMFSDEAAFGQDLDRYSDQKVAESSTRFLNSIQILDSNARNAVLREVDNARKAGVSLRSITIQGFRALEGRTTGAVKVVLEGVAGSIRKQIMFDTVVMQDQQRMTVLWRTVAQTYVETMSLSLERKKRNETDSFDQSSSQGVRGEYEQAFKRGKGTHIFAGTGVLSRLSGSSNTYMGDEKKSDFYSFMLSQDYAYVHTCVNDKNLRLNLWVGGGFRGTVTHAQSLLHGDNSPLLPSVGIAEVTPKPGIGHPDGTTKMPGQDTPGIGPKNASDTGTGSAPNSSQGTSSASAEDRLLSNVRARGDLASSGFGGTIQASESLGAIIAGRSGRASYLSTVSFSLLQDQGVSDPSNQKPMLQTGYRVNHSTGLAYNIGRGVYVDGTVNFVNIRTPVFDKNMGQLGVGVSLLNVAGVDGLDVRFEGWGESVKEGLDIKSLGQETLRQETRVTAGGKLNFRDGKNIYGVGFSGTQIADNVRGAKVTTGQAMATYSIMF